jgi:hypothetical protein
MRIAEFARAKPDIRPTCLAEALARAEAYVAAGFLVYFDPQN